MNIYFYREGFFLISLLLEAFSFEWYNQAEKRKNFPILFKGYCILDFVSK